jgi:hypothetical protein
MSLLATWQVMNFFQAVTMPTVVGETVKPGGLLVPKIRGFRRGFRFDKSSSPALMRGFAGESRLFRIPASPPD